MHNLCSTAHRNNRVASRRGTRASASGAERRPRARQCERIKVSAGRLAWRSGPVLVAGTSSGGARCSSAAWCSGSPVLTVSPAGATTATADLAMKGCTVTCARANPFSPGSQFVQMEVR